LYKRIYYVLNRELRLTTSAYGPGMSAPFEVVLCLAL